METWTLLTLQMGLPQYSAPMGLQNPQWLLPRTSPAVEILESERHRRFVLRGLSAQEDSSFFALPVPTTAKKAGALVARRCVPQATIVQTVPLHPLNAQPERMAQWKG